MQPYYHLVDLEFHLNLCGWNDNPFQDGLQSLPTEIKQYVRDGGKLNTYQLIETADGHSKVEKNDFVWRSSHDMM